MGMFSGASKTQISKFADRNYFDPNEYIVEILECKIIESNDKKSMIVEAVVLAKKHKSGPALGSTAAYFIAMKNGSKERSIWMNNLMSFMCAFYGCETEDYDDDEWEDMIEGAFEGNNLKGEVHKLKTSMNEAGTYTKHFWLGEPSDKDWDNYEFVLDD